MLCNTFIIILFTDPPNPFTDLRAIRVVSSNTLSVSWTQYSGQPLPTGYISYEATSGAIDTGTLTVSASASMQTISGRTRDAYTVRIAAISDQLPSTVVETQTISGKW